MSLTSSQLPMTESPSNGLLCDKCQGIPWDIFSSIPSPPTVIFDYHRTFAELEDSCKEGCPMCQNLCVMLVYDDVVSNRGDPLFWRMSPTRYIEVSLDDSWQSGVRRYSEMSDSNIISPGPQKHPTVQRLAPDTLEGDLEVLLDNISEWLTVCTKSGRHKKCGSLESYITRTSPLPTRLIDVGTQDQDILRLIDTQRECSIGSKTPHYLILSYRWGKGNESARTTKRNIQQRKKQMALQDFPKTIQDAIEITRRMGIRYLWVDAVCIIQPDNDRQTKDWLKESAKMANYYSNAYCCIAASSAEDSSEGILVERPVARYPLMEWRNRGGRVLESPHASRRSFRNPLLERGWCLQEWLLSRRILHWTRNGLIWQCKEGFFWESQSGFHGEDAQHFIEPLGKYVRSSNDCLFDLGLTHAPPIEIWQILEWPKDFVLTYQWNHLVFCYSKMNLTKPADRLAAIQGIATYMSGRHKVDYFAGIFHYKILDGLLWRRVLGGIYTTKTESFPSWSWASCRGAALISSVPNANSTSWMRWTCRFPSGKKIQTFRNLSDRQIHITAPLVPFKGTFQYNYQAEAVFELHPNSLVWPGEYIWITMDSAEFDSTCLNGAFLFFLRQRRDDAMSRHDLDGLVIKRSLSGSRNVYERIGMFDLPQGNLVDGLKLQDPRCLEDWRSDVILV